MNLNEFISEAERAQDALEKLKALKWECNTDENSDNCTIEEDFAAALEILKDLSLPFFASYKKGRSIGNWIVDHAHKCGCWKREKFDAWMVKQIQESGVKTEHSAGAKALDKPHFHYVRKKKDFAHQAGDGCWQTVNKETALEMYEAAGISNRKGDNGGLSPAQLELLQVIEHCAVDALTPLAGYEAGIHHVNGQKILVSSSYKLIEPKPYTKGSAKHVAGLSRGLLCLEDGTAEQFWHMAAFLQKSVLALRAGQRTGASAVFLCGLSDCGKTLFLNQVVVPLLGGRRADAYLYIAGRTSFNDELVGKECWLVDDGVPLEDAAGRRRFANLLKAAVSGSHVACHPKGQAQITLPLYRRLLVGLNPDDIQLLPPFAESMADKYLLFQAKRFEMPKGCLPLPTFDKRPEFAAQLAAELPYFLGWLLDRDLSAYSDRRFGVLPHKNADLLAASAEVSGLDSKYAVLVEAIFKSGRREADAVELKTSEIWMLLTKLFNESAMKVFRNPISVGVALRELADSPTHRHLVTKRTREGYSFWTIRQGKVKQTVRDGEGTKSDPHHDQQPEKTDENND